MADKPATGNPEDDAVTDSKQAEVSSKATESESKDDNPEEVALKSEETIPETTLAKPEETSPKVPDLVPVQPPPDDSKIDKAPPSTNPVQVSSEPCNRITAPPPMKSCSCTPKPSLREVFREALNKFCPKSRSASKTAVVCLDQKKHIDKDSGTQTPPQEVCLKAKDYTPFDGCQKRSGDVAKIDSQPAEKLVINTKPDNNGSEKPINTKLDKNGNNDNNGSAKPINTKPDKNCNNDNNGSGKPKDSPKEKEVENKSLEELPPCPYPCTPVDDYNKYDSTPIEKEPIAEESQEPAVPVVEDNSQGTTAKEPETPAPPPPETKEKKPIKEHCRKTPPQSQFCGYRKKEDE